MQETRSRRRTGLSPLFFLLVGSFPFSACDCEEETFAPLGRYEPATLNFGNVSVTGEKTLPVIVYNDGRAGLQITAANVTTDSGSGLFIAKPAPELMEPLAPGGTSTISVTYRPCPDAWDGDILKSDYDVNNCPEAPDKATLNIVDNAESGLVTLAGQPAQAPVLEVICDVAANQACGASPDFTNATECITLAFPNLNSDDPPCDIELEIRNKERDGKPTGDLVIESVDLLVREINDNTIIPGEEAGFTVLDEGGQPLQVDSANPLLVPIPTGDDIGKRRLTVRFEAKTPGTFSGRKSENSGLRLFSNDPDNRPVKTVSVSATASTPDIRATPASVDFGSVPQGTTATTSVCLGNNAGNAPLVITDIRFRDDQSGGTFSFTTNDPSFPTNPKTVNPGQPCGLTVTVRYTPSGGQDLDVMLVGSNDPDENPLEIEVRGGAIPKIETDPPDVLVFALPSPLPPPPIPPRTENLTVRNIGAGDLDILQIELLGPDDSPSHPSVDDFSIQGCAGFPCTPNLTLCPPARPGCTSSETQFAITYNNNDASTTDDVNLFITSNDPARPRLNIQLRATDVPCLYPTPVITVETAQKVVGQEVCLNALSSSPGGPPGGSTTVDEYEWGQVFGPEAISFNPPDTVRTCFVPNVDGVFQVSLHVKNSCGSRSQSPATELMTVVPE